MAGVHAAMESWAEALECYHMALTIARIAICAELSDGGTADSRRGDEYAAAGLLEEALASFLRALDLRRRTYGENSANVAVSYHAKLLTNSTGIPK